MDCKSVQQCISKSSCGGCPIKPVGSRAAQREISRLPLRPMRRLASPLSSCQRKVIWGGVHDDHCSVLAQMQSPIRLHSSSASNFATPTSTVWALMVRHRTLTRKTELIGVEHYVARAQPSHRPRSVDRRSIGNQMCDHPHRQKLPAADETQHPAGGSSNRGTSRKPRQVQIARSDLRWP
jgi:hypothetical protein